MNMKNFKNIALSLVAGCGLAVTLAACADWDDHYVGTAGSEESGASLWEQMKANPRLSDFCEVLEQTKVYRMHQKKPVSYADLLSGGQAYTVMAPVNGTFNKDSLLQLVQTVVGDSSVERSFVQNHITRSLVSVNPASTRMLMLNLKRISMENGFAGGVPVIVQNQRASNGVLHVVEKALPYNYNLYEMFCDNADLQEIGNRLRRFNEDIFVPEQSLQNGVIDGVPVYIDSVIYERNRLLDNIGLLRAEDSTYVVVAPTTEGWKAAWDEASTYYNYEDTLTVRDSLQQFYATRALLQDAVFNMTDQKSPNDSLISVPYLRENLSYKPGKHVYHVFNKPFAEGGILYGATPLACSNGTIYATDQWPFTPEDTYFKEIYIEGESTHLIADYKKCVYNSRQINADSVSEGRYLRIDALNSSSTENWDIEFQIDNTLSGTYDVYAIVLPKSVYNQTSPDLRPCGFKATIYSLDQKGKKKSYTCKPAKGSEFVNNPERIDTILLAQGFKFDVCNYGQVGTRASIKLSSNINFTTMRTRTRELFLDCIYLKPRTSKSE